MTLTLTLASPWGIYQSSDYRLTNLIRKTALPEDDYSWLKAVDCTFRGRRISDLFHGSSSGWESKHERLDRRHLNENATAHKHRFGCFRHRHTRHASHQASSPNLRALTVVIAIAEAGRKLRLALISNIDRLGMNRRDPPLDYLEVAGLTPSRPELLVLG